MINNNLDMIRKMDNPYNYDRYVELCNEKDIPVRPLGQYLQGIAVLQYALNKYGGDWQEAYLKGYEDINKQDLEATQTCGDKIEVNNSFFLDKEISDRRMGICTECEFLVKNFCKKCMCFMPAKVRLKKATCKENKW